ncbi:hypothetical protein CERSUDRAFT_118434 [Gelatoporia subvermispora B]|uniref:Ketoreductase (KR) domain-containing protein n=1 Tax=Ceriporiopsis subvermispora (strain B) TaxID=914234 RepID=M2Q866_CERS8|nr:hypothetical protein CERSUDRAFT_118434 [Gelatoporia subvermispora B]
MVLQVAYVAISTILPSKYWLRAGVTAGALLIVHAFARGPNTSRERNLHARTVIITGGFTPLGLSLITALARRGAHIIALSPYPLDHPYPSVLIPLLRSTTNNENIYAEYADLSNAASVRDFCTRFLTGSEQRLDAIIFGHEYHGIGSLFGLGHTKESKVATEETRETASLATFLIATLLLPALLVAPTERDIRIVNVVNPFYAAAIPTFASDLVSPPDLSSASVFYLEGRRALRSIVLTRHLQRVLDSLPNRAPTKEDKAGSSTDSQKECVEPRQTAHAPSNIVATSVSPGISRKDTIAPLFAAERDMGHWSLFGFVLYYLLFPIVWLFSKTSDAAMQTALHVLFLPTPFKSAFAKISASINPGSADNTSEQQSTVDPAVFAAEEVLKPGALYRECAVVTTRIPVPSSLAPAANEAAQDNADKKGKGKKKEGEKATAGSETSPPDDGELGGEALGRAVWEWYEMKLKVWEARFKDEKAKSDDKTPTQTKKE